MKYTQQSGSSQGAWVDKSKLISGMKAVIASEVEPVQGEFEGKANTRNVAKISIEGGEAQNLSFNRATLNALVEAFGEESNEWQGESVIIQARDSIIGGKSVIIVYLVPEGFELGKDAKNYVIIQRKDDIPIVND